MNIVIEPIATDADWDEWLRLFASRNEVADVYARLLRDWGPTAYDYAPLNAAILRRWSMAGLRYIKTRAWKQAVA